MAISELLKIFPEQEWPLRIFDNENKNGEELAQLMHYSSVFNDIKLQMFRKTKVQR